MAGTAEYQQTNFGTGFSQGRILSELADMSGYSTVEQKLRELLGSPQPTSTPAQPMAEQQASPTAQATPEMSEDEMYPEGKSEWIRQYLSQTPTPAPTATPTTSESLMGMLGLGRKQ